MAENLIVDDATDAIRMALKAYSDFQDGAPQDPQPDGDFTNLVVPIPANLNAEQIAFWRWFPRVVTPLGELRRKIGLTRREWYYPARNNPRYDRLADLSNHLQREPERVKQLLEDESAFLAYVATLRLQGA